MAASLTTSVYVYVEYKQKKKRQQQQVARRTATVFFMTKKEGERKNEESDAALYRVNAGRAFSFLSLFFSSVCFV